jgi:hypothetical protein
MFLTPSEAERVYGLFPSSRLPVTIHKLNTHIRVNERYSGIDNKPDIRL